MSFKSIAVTFRKVKDGLVRFAKLERILASLLLFFPLFLIVFDGEPVKPNISDYYKMNNNQVYYFLLTMASMLYIFNGVVKKKKWYNTILGIALAGVILFPGLECTWTHRVFAFIFFIGNPIMFVVFTSKEQRWMKCLMFLGIVTSFGLTCLIDAFTVFIAEWISLAIIAIHFILESCGIFD